MINDLKTFCKITHFATNKKSVTIMSAAILLLGVFYIILSREYEDLRAVGIFYGTFFIYCGMIMHLQSYMTVQYAKLVQSAPGSSKMKGRITMNYVTLVAGLIFVIVVGIGMISHAFGGYSSAQINGVILSIAAMGGTLCIPFYVACYRKYILSSAIWTGIGIPVMILCLNKGLSMANAIAWLNMPIGVTIAIGVGLIVTGNLFARLLVKIMYKMPLDKKALGVLGQHWI